MTHFSVFVVFKWYFLFLIKFSVFSFYYYYYYFFFFILLIIIFTVLLIFLFADLNPLMNNSFPSYIINNKYI